MLWYVIAGSAIFAIEFKVGEREFSRDDINQVWDYALDLKNFHKGSHEAPIFPILVATEALESDKMSSEWVPSSGCSPSAEPVQSRGLPHLLHAWPRAVYWACSER